MALSRASGWVGVNMAWKKGWSPSSPDLKLPTLKVPLDLHLSGAKTARESDFHRFPISELVLHQVTQQSSLRVAVADGTLCAIQG